MVRTGFAVICLGLSVLFPSHASPASRAETWEEAKSQAIRLMELGDCAGVWDTLWPWVKAGNSEARFATASAMAFGGLVPPGESRDLLSLWRHITILVLFSENINKNEWGDSYDILFRSVVSPLLASIDEYGFDKYKECYLINKDQACWKVAVSEKLIPPFDQYLLQLETIVDKGSPLDKATCPER